LKEAVRSLQQEHADRACDYVLIARRSALDHPFDDLIADLATAFRRVNRMRSCRNET
jgi:RNase P protein component